MIKTSHLQCVRLLFSIDLSGSTDFKSQSQRKASLSEKDTEWPNTFGEFYSEVSTEFIQKASELVEKYSKQHDPCRVSLWKAIGDEVTFYSSPIPTESQVAILCHAFARVIDKFDQNYFKKHKLGVKGTVWSAGFPLRNKLIRFDPKNAPYFKIVQKDSDESLVQVSPSFAVDFLGPDIDLGFRLASHSVPGRVAVSLDVAVHLAHAAHSFDYPVRMFHVGWASLKGIQGNIPYPIIWIDTLQGKVEPKPRTSYEEADNPFSSKYLNRSGHMDSVQMLELNRRHFRDTKEYRLEKQYLTSRDLPPADVKPWERTRKQSSIDSLPLLGDDE